MGSKETPIQKKIVDFLERKKLWVVRNNTQGIFMALPNGKYTQKKNKNKGSADLELRHKGVTIFLEVKSENGKLSPDQHTFAKKAIDNGFNYFVVRSVEDVKSCLKEIGIKI